MKRALIASLPILLMLALIGCAPATIADKKVVQLNYKGTLADGTVFSESEPGKPLEFQVGAGNMIPALEKGVLGLKVGEKKTIEIKAADAYGEYDASAVQDVPTDQFPTDTPPVVGQRYSVQTAGGTIQVVVAAVKDKSVTIDFNHPLAGKDLTFAVEVVKIREATREELAAAKAAAVPTPQ